MNVEEARSLLTAGGGQQFFIPSFGKNLLFKKMSTGIQKILGKTMIDGVDVYTANLTRLGLFDDMLLEGTREYKSSQLTIVDTIAFLAQLRRNATGSEIYDFGCICPSCGEANDMKINLNAVIENCKKHEFKKLEVELDDEGKNYKFELSDASWLDLLILQESIRHMNFEYRESVLESKVYYAFSKVCMHIRSIKLNGSEVKSKEDFPFHKWDVPDRIAFFDCISQRITIDERQEKSLIRIVGDNFNDIEMSQRIFDGSLVEKKCKKCNIDMESAITYDTFFSIC